MGLKLMYITNNPQVAVIAQKYGVDRVWVDLETLGKEERQGHIDSVKSHHSIEDIEKIVPFLNKSEMLVRVNPLNAGSEKEINAVIAAGADLIMLPMWKSVEDVQKFLDIVNKRCKTVLLLETKEAVECLDAVLALGGIDEIHIGLNDLHLSYKLDFMFELLANGTVESICKRISKSQIPYGFGGIARLGCGELPAEKIIQEHYRLGSTRAILSRSFCNAQQYSTIEEIDDVFAQNMKMLRDYEMQLDKQSQEDFERNRQSVVKIVRRITEMKAGAK
ncbi:aldolase [Selenomonas caprae]|uniref:Aldolase n=1 Tax=Selenomonas caprae TaxID=2606905 RepID=A0A5D6WNY8_9FIRM|nr:aldolase/citrate lyase family protein [Selenomonas caprae]TYZ29122.1 aldolase [Selenomonas caprae]